MFNHLHLAHLNKKNIQILAFILLFPLFVTAQTEAERSKITSAYDQKAIAALKEKFQQAQNEREARIALYLQQNKVERTFSQNGVVFSLYDIGSNRVPIYTKTKNVASGQVINAHKLYNGGSLGLNIQGQGMVAGVWDTGPVRATHELLSGQATQIDGSTITDVGGRDHMAHVTGTIVGKALSNGNAQAESARGIAFNATARCYDSQNDLTEMTAFGGAGFLISNHSYGYPNKATDPVWQLGAYDVQAKDWDLTVKTMPNYLPFVAGGNEQTSSANAASKGGYDVISGNSAAKNVMTVGAVNGDLTMSDYSNWGPTDDGRFKPEIVAKGTGINSAQSTADNAYSGIAKIAVVLLTLLLL